MQIINKEEADCLLLLTGSREIAVSGKLKGLKIGEGLVVKRSEWKAKYAPTKIARKIEKEYGWKFKGGRMSDNSGWLMQREL